MPSTPITKKPASSPQPKSPPLQPSLSTDRTTTPFLQERSRASWSLSHQRAQHQSQNPWPLPTSLHRSARSMPPPPPMPPESHSATSLQSSAGQGVLRIGERYLGRLPCDDCPLRFSLPHCIRLVLPTLFGLLSPRKKRISRFRSEFGDSFDYFMFLAISFARLDAARRSIFGDRI